MTLADRPKQPPTNRQRKRDHRGPKPPRDVAVIKVRTERPAHIEDTRSTALTDRERRALLKQAKALGDGVDLAYMGVRLLEVRFCGWAAEHWLADPAAESMSKAARAAWADRQFRDAEEWWSSLHHATRAHLVRLTRACASPEPIGLGHEEDPWPGRAPEPIGLGHEEDPWPGRARKVWRVPG